jgi:chromosome partitioning protein
MEFDASFESCPMPVVVAFLSQKGGTGKSTLARALAAIVAHTGHRVRVADLDDRQQTIIEWEKLRRGSGLPAVEVEAFSDTAKALAGGQPGELLIVDAPAGASRRTLQIARNADLVVQPCGGSVDDLRPAVLLFHELVQAGIPKNRLVIALCRMLGEREEERARTYLGKAGFDVLPGSIPEKLGYREAHNRGQAVSEAKDRSLKQRVDHLMDALFDKVDAQLKAKANQEKAAKTRTSS